jgi:hypothetical protein
MPDQISVRADRLIARLHALDEHRAASSGPAGVGVAPLGVPGQVLNRLEYQCLHSVALIPDGLALFQGSRDLVLSGPNNPDREHDRYAGCPPKVAR